MIPLNPLECKGNYSATSIHNEDRTLAADGGCYIWYSEEGTGLGSSPPKSILAVPNRTVHPSTASVLITV